MLVPPAASPRRSQEGRQIIATMAVECRLGGAEGSAEGGSAEREAVVGEMPVEMGKGAEDVDRKSLMRQWAWAECR